MAERKRTINEKRESLKRDNFRDIDLLSDEEIERRWDETHYPDQDFVVE